MNIATQPIIDISEKSIFAYEVLARNSNKNEFSPPPPNHIFWGLIDCQALQLADKLLLDKPHIITNISEATLADDRLFAQWSLVARSRMAKNTLSIEITEQVSDHTLAHRWKQLKALGVKIALDDFGQENSSLARLQNYDWDIAKFEVDLPTGFSDYQMVGIEECAGRGITMIAERIENKQQALTAKDAGLILQQGFLWAHPEIVTTPIPIVDKISA
jgi:EAL domain-containing protein (putative c-di-GMP-specific phosphodiesterase class I)